MDKSFTTVIFTGIKVLKIQRIATTMMLAACMAASVLCTTAWTQSESTLDTFVEPDVRRSVNGLLNTVLRIAYEEQVIGKDKVRLRNYEESLVGPTFRFRPGDRVKVHLFNHLPLATGECNTYTHNGCNTTNLHTHGLHVSPAGNSDNVLLTIQPGQDFQFVFDIPNDHPAGTFWYHPHLHGTVAVQVGSGMAGALIIEGDIDEVPAIKAAKERLFVFQQIPYDPNTKTVEWKDADLGVNPYTGFTTVNGVVQPTLVMRPGEVQRWRFIYGGIKEELDLSLQKVEDEAEIAGQLASLITPLVDRESALRTLAAKRQSDLSAVPGGPSRLPMYLIAYDGITLGRLDTLMELELDPGNRADVLVQAPMKKGMYTLHKAGKTQTEAARQVEVLHDILAKVVVEGVPVNMSLPTPSELAALVPLPDIKDDELTNKGKPREMVFAMKGGPKFEIDGIPFQYPPAKPGDVIELKLNDVEEWKLTSNWINHPFHIHVNPFQVIKIGDRMLESPRWQDTILVKENEPVIIRTRYQVFTGEFVMHCHYLDHEDQGMMRLLRIVK